MEVNSRKRTPLISVIVPVYNVQEYLNACIKSILTQTYKNIEVILIDDGSTDNSGEICDSFKVIDERIVVIHKSNGGLSDARNVGLTFAQGEYIGFVDSDDWVDGCMYETLLRELMANNADISVCEKVMFGENQYIDCGKTGKIEVCSREVALDYLYQDEKYRSHVWNKLYKKELFDNVEFPKGKHFEDVFVMHRIFERASKIVFVDKGLYYYRQREDSIVHTQNVEIWGDFLEALMVREKADSAIGREKQIYGSWIQAVERIKRLNGKKIHINGELVNVTELLVQRYSLRYGLLLGAKAFAVSFLFHIFEWMKVNKGTIKRSLFICHFGGNRSRSDLNNGTEKRRIILMGSPEYNNIGDLAIAYSISKIVSEILPDYKYIEISEDIILSGTFPHGILQKDLILLIGGGNFGDYYKDQHIIRKKVLKKYNKNRIIIFPQTIFFSDTPRGEREAIELKKILHKCQQVSIFFREKQSYSKALELFETSKIFICPDIVFYNKYPNNDLRQGVLVCFRHDKEAVLDECDRQTILDWVFNLNSTVHMWDTCLSYRVPIIERDAVVEKAIQKISGFKLVVTDRLHCMIFCAITGTPCIAIDNKNHKISSSYEWVKSLGFISCLNELSMMESEAHRLMKECSGGSTNRIDSEMFANMIHKLLED